MACDAVRRARCEAVKEKDVLKLLNAVSKATRKAKQRLLEVRGRHAPSFSYRGVMYKARSSGSSRWES